MDGPHELPKSPGLADPCFHTDQYRAYARLREFGPVSSGRYYDGTAIWLVADYEASRAVLQDPCLVNDPSKQSNVDVPAAFGIPPDVRPFFVRHLLSADPPDHTRLRRLITPTFSAARVRALRPFLERTVASLLDDMGEEEVVDFVDRFAVPLPFAVISEILGLHQNDRDNWREWVSAFDQSQAAPNGQEGLTRGARRMVEFARGLVHLRRVQPAEDLVSALVRTHDVTVERLDDVELVAMVMGLLGAGYRTTSRLLAGGLFTLLCNPEEFDLLRERPSLVPNAIEEMLRFRTPLEIAPALRFAIQDVEIGGVRIPRGDAVQVILAAPNRDPNHFPEPDRFLVERMDNPHLAFGHGIHFCPGATLARAEVEIALRALLARFPGVALAVQPEEVRWQASFSRGPVRLPVRLR